MSMSTDMDSGQNTVSLTRKLRRSGNSTVLTIPSEILEEADLDREDKLGFSVDGDGQVTLTKSDA